MERFKGPKGLTFGAGLMGALAGAYLLGSVTLGGVFAQTPGTDQADDQSPAYSSSIRVAENESLSEAEESAALQSLAKITADQARSAALARFPGATVNKVELENENGALVYGVELTDASGASHDVKVDAGNSEVLHVEAEDADGAHGEAADSD